MEIGIEICDLATKDHKSSKRQYAHTYHKPLTICVTREFFSLPDSHFYAILCHEIGHLIGGRGEKKADQAANKFFGVKIKYLDSPWGKRLEYLDPNETKKVKKHIRIF